jgi:MFS family permease
MSAKIHWSQIPNNTHPIWYKDPGLRWNVAHGLGLCLVIATNGFGASLLGGFQAIPSWIKFFNAPKGTTLGLYAASYFLPSVFTAYIGDFISGRYGRRWAIFVGMFLMLVGGVLNSFAVNIAMWIVGRAIIGAGVGVVKVRTLLVARSDSDS